MNICAAFSVRSNGALLTGHLRAVRGQSGKSVQSNPALNTLPSTPNRFQLENAEIEIAIQM